MNVYDTDDDDDDDDDKLGAELCCVWSTTVLLLLQFFSNPFSSVFNFISVFNGLSLGMCGMDFSSLVRFGFEKNCRFGSYFFVDQL